MPWGPFKRILAFLSFPGLLLSVFATHPCLSPFPSPPCSPSLPPLTSTFRHPRGGSTLLACQSSALTSRDVGGKLSYRPGAALGPRCLATPFHFLVGGIPRLLLSSVQGRACLPF